MQRGKYHKTSWLRHIIECVPFVFIVFLMAMVVGCVTERQLLTLESTIPANFTTYTEETGLFSISYPPDWEPVSSVLEEADINSKEVIESIESDALLEGAGEIFFAGVPTGTGYDPNVNIMVEPLSEVTWTLDNVVEAEIRQHENVSEEYHEFSRVKTAIGGREAVILDWEGNESVLDSNHQLQVYMLEDKIVWCVTCATSPEQFDDLNETFQEVIRSLRILREY